MVVSKKFSTKEFSEWVEKTYSFPIVVEDGFFQDPKLILPKWTKSELENSEYEDNSNYRLITSSLYSNLNSIIYKFSLNKSKIFQKTKIRIGNPSDFLFIFLNSAILKDLSEFSTLEGANGYLCCIADFLKCYDEMLFGGIDSDNLEILDRVISNFYYLKKMFLDLEKNSIFQKNEMKIGESYIVWGSTDNSIKNYLNAYHHRTLNRFSQLSRIDFWELKNVPLVYRSRLFINYLLVIRIIVDGIEHMSLESAYEIYRGSIVEII